MRSVGRLVKLRPIVNRPKARIRTTTEGGDRQAGRGVKVNAGHFLF
jgi:hypothetical protein